MCARWSTPAICRGRPAGGKARDDAAVGGEGPRQDVHGRRADRHRHRPSLSHHRRARIRLHRRPLGLRQEHVPPHRRRLRASERGRAPAQRTPDRPAGSRSRHDVPGALAVPLAYGHRECGLAAGDEGAGQARAARQGCGFSRPRASAPFRRPLSRTVEWRHEAAGRAGATVRARPRGHAHGRAVRRARFADPGIAAGGAAVDLAARAQDRAVRHPRHRRGDLSRHPGHRLHRAARPHQGRHPSAQRRPLRRLPQVVGIPRRARPGLGSAARRGAQGARIGGSVRISRTSVQNWLLPIAALVAWEVLGRAGLLPRYLSVPSAILAALWEIALTGELFTALAASLYRVAVGFALGTAAGTIVGLGAGVLPGVRHFFDPLVSFLYSIPKIAFLPVFLLLFGLGHASKIAIIAFSGFFPVFIASRHAVLSVNRILIWAAQNMGTPPRTVFFRVIVPAAAPQLFSGIRIGLAHAFVVLFAAELIGSKVGLGTIISYGEEWVRFDLMFAGIVCFAVLGFLSDRMLLAIRSRVLKGQMLGTEEEIVR